MRIKEKHRFHKTSGAFSFIYSCTEYEFCTVDFDGQLCYNKYTVINTNQTYSLKFSEN